jgi:hypothetical protein
MVLMLAANRSMTCLPWTSKLYIRIAGTSIQARHRAAGPGAALNRL